MQEGCLSVPDIFDDVDRPARCRVAYLDRNGASAEDACAGLLAACIQHEIDHLEGILFIDRLSRLKREMVVNRLRKARRRAAAPA